MQSTLPFPLFLSVFRISNIPNGESNLLSLEGRISFFPKQFPTRVPCNGYGIAFNSRRRESLLWLENEEEWKTVSRNMYIRKTVGYLREYILTQIYWYLTFILLHFHGLRFIAKLLFQWGGRRHTYTLNVHFMYYAGDAFVMLHSIVRLYLSNWEKLRRLERTFRPTSNWVNIVSGIQI